MTQKEFWEIYAKTAKYNKFSIEPNGFIRRRRVCPVCGVANYLLKQSKYVSRAYTAGKEIGLREYFVKEIIRASDCINMHDVEVRDKLLKLGCKGY